MNVFISPQSGIIEFNSTTAGSSLLGPLDSSVRISFRNTGELVITSFSSGTANRFSVDGNQGRLFNVTDNASGTLYSVNDIAGIPIFQVFDDDRVEMGQYNSYALVASGVNVGIGTNNPTQKLDVLGTAKVWQIKLSGHNGDSRTYDKGDIWYNSRDNVLRTKLNTSGDSLALGKTFAIFKATDSYGAISPATTGVRNGIRTLVFGDAAALSTNFIGIVPSGICLNSGITARLFWTAASATTNNVLWSISFENMWTDLDADSFATATSGVSAAGTPAGALNTGVYNCTSIDSLRESLPYRVRITRSAADVLDNMTGNAELILLELQATL